MIKQIKKKRIIQEVNIFLNTLSHYNDDFGQCDRSGYYNNVDFDYIFIENRTNCIYLNRRLKEYGLDNHDLFPIIKKFTEKYNYDILWDTGGY